MVWHPTEREKSVMLLILHYHCTGILNPVLLFFPFLKIMSAVYQSSELQVSAQAGIEHEKSKEKMKSSTYSLGTEKKNMIWHSKLCI